MKDKLNRFMQGRYGNDMLNNILMGFVFVCFLLSMFVSGIFYGVGVVLIFIIYFRMFSRNTYKRTRENEFVMVYYNKVSRFFSRQRNRMKQRKTHHIYTCPTCNQKIKIPRGKGKIAVCCPKCGNEFIKKS